MSQRNSPTAKSAQKEDNSFETIAFDDLQKAIRDHKVQQQNFYPQPTIEAPRDVNNILRGFIVTDILALFFGFLFAWLLALAINAIYFDRVVLNSLNQDELRRMTGFVVLSFGAILYFEREGHYRIRMPFWVETRKVIEVIAFAMMINGFLQFASKLEFSRLWLMSSWVFAAMGIIAFRAIYRHILRTHGQWQIPTLLVGNGSTANETKAALLSEPGFGYEIVAEIDNLPTALHSVGNTWNALCATHKANYVILALDGYDLANSKPQLTQLMREQIPFSVTPPLQFLPVNDMTPQYFFSHDVTMLTRTSGLDQPLPRFIKRSFDIVVSLLSLIVLSPVLIAIVLMVRKDGGPAVYSHKRLGVNGKAFGCLKFRSMIVNSDEVMHHYLENNPEAETEWMNTRKLRHDPRITRVGSFLRKWSLDELPQLINVLKGEMSIVGPRPIVVAETDKYDSDIVDYYRVRPGLTGLWQVSGRNNVSYGQRVRMDSWYVRNWSLWHDVMIICKTFPVLLKRVGAY